MTKGYFDKDVEQICFNMWEVFLKREEIEDRQNFLNKETTLFSSNTRVLIATRAFENEKLKQKIDENVTSLKTFLEESLYVSDQKNKNFQIILPSFIKTLEAARKEEDLRGNELQDLLEKTRDPFIEMGL